MRIDIQSDEHILWANSIKTDMFLLELAVPTDALSVSCADGASGCGGHADRHPV